MDLLNIKGELIMKRYVLAVDGGGIFGLIPSILLNNISEKTYKMIPDMFDLFVGVSTGGLVCSILNLPSENPTRKYKYHTQDLIRFYKGERAEKIFTPKFFKFPLSSVKYPSKNIDSVLKDVCGDLSIQKLVKSTMFLTYDTVKRQSMFLKSYDKNSNFKIWEACRATSSAPTFFEPFNKEPYCLIDGAMVGNNPSIHAYIEAKKMFPEDEIIVVSIGTGSKTKPYFFKDIKKWSILKWASNLFGIISDGQNDASEYLCGEILGDKYYRFNFPLPNDLDEMDNVSDPYINRIEEVTKNAIEGRWKDLLDKLVTELNS